MALQASRRLLSLLQTTANNSLLLSTFAVVGGLWSTYTLYQLSTFLHLHFLHRTNLPLILSSRTKHGLPDSNPTARPYALVTGASDGIGRAYAEELAVQGFNLILFGRSPTKLADVKTSIFALHPSLHIHTVPFDAATLPLDKLQSVFQPMQDLPIRILINNISGGAFANDAPLCATHAARPTSYDSTFLNIDLLFTLDITRQVLPFLTKDSSTPALILNVGSGASRLPLPYIALVGASKMFLENWSRSLQAEMIAEGYSHVEVQSQLVGQVSTAREPRPVTFSVPTAKIFARSSLQKAGSRWRVLWGYWPHALGLELAFRLPTWFVERIATGIVNNQIMKEDEARRKKDRGG